MHLLVDSTGLKLCGTGEWLIEKHGTHIRRSWKKLHIGLDAGTGEIVASAVKIGTRPIGQCPMTACQRPRSVCCGQTRYRQVRRLRRPAMRLRDLTAARGRETRIDAVDAVLCASPAVRVRT